MPRLIGSSGYGGGGAASGGGGATAGWESLFALNMTAATPTTWTSADNGNTETVDGIDYVISSLSTGSASIGSASGLVSSDGTSTLRVKTGIDLTQATVGHVIAVVVALKDSGIQSGIQFGDSWDDCWSILRLAGGSITTQRRAAGIQYTATTTLAEDTIDAFLLICTTGGVDLYTFTGAVDLDDLPKPDDSGWVEESNSGTTVNVLWPITGSDGLLQFWQNGDAELEVYAFEVFRVAATL